MVIGKFPGFSTNNVILIYPHIVWNNIPIVVKEILLNYVPACFIINKKKILTTTEIQVRILIDTPTQNVMSICLEKQQDSECTEER